MSSLVSIPMKVSGRVGKYAKGERAGEPMVSAFNDGTRTKITGMFNGGHYFVASLFVNGDVSDRLKGNESLLVEGFLKNNESDGKYYLNLERGPEHELKVAVFIDGEWETLPTSNGSAASDDGAVNAAMPF